MNKKNKEEIMNKKNAAQKLVPLTVLALGIILSLSLSFLAGREAGIAGVIFFVMFFVGFFSTAFGGK